MVEIANDELLRSELRLRGGTCLHKLHLDRPFRYSEDLDYVRSTHSGFGPYVDAIRAIGESAGLTVTSVQRSGQNVHVIFDADPTTPPGTIRIKIETNVAETTPYRDPITIPHAVDSRWWSGEADIPTFMLEELLGTKLRALYQRSKGRDLFDHWLFLTTHDLDYDAIIGAFQHYMTDDAFTYPQLAQNLKVKLLNAEFRNDLEELVIELPLDYTVEEAADLLMEHLGLRLHNAPPIEQIAAGRWRM
jgi:predicted nucleotidyltransferase component of viral defense system